MALDAGPGDVVVYKGIAPWKVLYDSGDSFKRFMRNHTEEVVKLMTKKKIIDKKAGKLALKDKNDPLNIVLGFLSQVSMKKFISYLELLIEISAPTVNNTSDVTPSKTDQTEICSNDSIPNTSTLGEDTKQLMKIMQGSLEAMKPEPGSKLHAVISNFVEQTFDIESQTAVQCVMVQTGKSAPLKPPDGQLGNSVSRVFTMDGGMLYSPIHGVTVTISPNAIPEGVDRYNLSMHFYLHGPFSLPDDVDHCSVVVWFHQSPHFEFLEDVTIKIPHAATVDDSLCVLTWGKDRQGPVYKLDTEIPADFSDSYHAEFKVKQFCPKTVVCKKSGNTRKKNGIVKNMEKMNSDSLEKSVEEGLAVDRSGSAETSPSSRQLHHQEAMDCDSLAHASLEREGSGHLSQDREEGCGIRYSIACCMPRDRSGSQWGVTFAACYSHPTGDWVLRKKAEYAFGGNYEVSSLGNIKLPQEYFELSPALWSENGWKVNTSIRPALIYKEKIQQISREHLALKSEFDGQLSGLEWYPPSMSYKVCYKGETQPYPELDCWIEAQGAVTVTGSPPSFNVTPTVTNEMEGQRVLLTSSYLYKDNSNIIRALTSQADDIILDTRKPDHTKFLADISMQLSLTEELYAAFGRSHYQDQDTFMVLDNWVAHQGTAASLKRFKQLLQGVRVANIVCKNPTNVDRRMISPHLDKHNVCTVSRSSSISDVMLKLPEKLQCCWKDVGRLLGISAVDLHSIEIEHQNDVLSEQSYQMLNGWQRREGEQATIGALFRAIHCTFLHQPSLVNDAHKYCDHYLRHYLPVPS